MFPKIFLTADLISKDKNKYFLNLKVTYLVFSGSVTERQELTNVSDPMAQIPT